MTRDESGRGRSADRTRSVIAHPLPRRPDGLPHAEELLADQLASLRRLPQVADQTGDLIEAVGPAVQRLQQRLQQRQAEAAVRAVRLTAVGTVIERLNQAAGVVLIV